MFNLTKDQLLDIIANDEDPDQRVDAQAELDRRAAKKAAKRNAPVAVDNSMGDTITELSTGIVQAVNRLARLRDDAKATGTMPAFVDEVIEIMGILENAGVEDESLAGLPLG